MQATSSRRAAASVFTLLTSPSYCMVERRFYQQLARRSNSRYISSTSQRWQQSAPSAARVQPTSAPQTPPPSQAAANAQKVSNTLSPSSDTHPLRSLTDGLDDPPTILSEDEKQVDWTRSFQGLSSSPFTPEQAEILQRKLAADDIEIKPDGIIYLPEIKYRRILNAAFGPGGWGLAPRGETIVTSKIVTREYGLVCGGRSVIQVTIVWWFLTDLCLGWYQSREANNSTSIQTVFPQQLRAANPTP